MNPMNLISMIKSDVWGLLAPRDEVMRWGFVFSMQKGSEFTTSRKRYYKMHTAIDAYNRMIKSGAHGCVFRQVKNSVGEWVLTNTQEFDGWKAVEA